MIQRIRRRDFPFVAAFLLPGLLILSLVVIFPVLLAMQYSAFEASSFTGGGEFVGLDNYTRLVGSGEFWASAWRTVVYALGSVVAQIVLGIAIALVLNTTFRGNQALRGAALVPYILPAVVATIGWEWILDPSAGIVNHLLGMMMSVGPINFLSADLAMVTAIGLSTWAWTPFVTLVFLSGLQTIPDELYESANIDGAGMFQRFWSVTLPLMRDLLITIAVLRGIWMFNKFDLVYLLTAGGPLKRTQTLPVMIYEQTFNEFNVGYGSALAVVTMVVMIVAMTSFLALTKERKVRPQNVRTSEGNQTHASQ